jgi:TRAP-type transport system periplasmic protein
MAGLKLHFCGYQSANSVHTKALHVLADAARKPLGGGIEIAITENVTAEGRRADDLLAMTGSGEIDGCYFSSSYLAARVPALGLFDRPFGFAGRAAAYEVLDGPAGRQMAGDVARATGFRVLGFWDNGIRHISNARHPIRRPADCAGLRIRTLNNVDHQAFFRRLGFVPTFIDVKDLVRAAAEGTIDAQENPLTNILHFGLHRHHRFVSMTAHLFGVALLLVNRRRYEEWPDEVRRAVDEAAAAATATQRRAAAAEDDICAQRLAADGVAITEAHDLDHAAFEQAAADECHRP